MCVKALHIILSFICSAFSHKLKSLDIMAQRFYLLVESRKWATLSVYKLLRPGNWYLKIISFYAACWNLAYLRAEKFFKNM